MATKRRPSINKEIFSTLIALPLLHPLDCHAGLLFKSKGKAREAHFGPNDAPHVEGYRLCCDFTDVGLVNLVADLLSEDTAATHNRSLCGLVYVGCGSGIEHASSQAHAFFKVLCAAMARVMCLNKDRSDAEKISGDLTRRLRCFIGIVSLRDVVQIGARGEFLQHETHCFGARFQDSNIPDEVFDMVCETIKRRLSAPESPSPVPNPLPADTKASSDVFVISDDEGENSPVEKSAYPEDDGPLPDGIDLQDGVDALLETGEEVESTEKRGGSLAADSGDEDFSAGVEHAENEVRYDALPHTRTHSNDDKEGSTTPAHRQSSAHKSTSTSSNGTASAISRVSSSSVETCNTSPAPADSVGLCVGTGARESKHLYQDDTRKDPKPVGSAGPGLEDGEGGAKGSRVLRSSAPQAKNDGGKLKLERAQSKLEQIKSDLGAASQLGQGGGSEELVVLARKFSAKTANSGEDMRKHFAASCDGDRRGGDRHVVLSLDIVPGFGAEAKRWPLYEPSFFSWQGSGKVIPMTCRGFSSSGSAEDVSFGDDMQWGKEQAYEMWQRKMKAYTAEYDSHFKTWEEWVACIPPEIVRGEGLASTSDVSCRKHDASADDEELKEMFAKGTGLLPIGCSVAIDRSVLAAVVDIAYGDVEHESIGVLYGNYDADQKELIITDCKNIKRAVDTLDFHSVQLSPQQQIEISSDKTKGELVGWFHTHLHHQPLPSKADVDLQRYFTGNLPSKLNGDSKFDGKTTFVGLICSFDASSVLEGNECKRITFTAFRAPKNDVNRGVRVKWRVRETPGFSPGAVQCCFDGLRHAEEENRELCWDFFNSTQNVLKKKWLLSKWDEYLIRLVQGAVPLVLQQLEQSSSNLSIQHAQIATRFGRQKLNNGVGPLPVCKQHKKYPSQLGSTLLINHKDEPDSNGGASSSAAHTDNEESDNKKSVVSSSSKGKGGAFAPNVAEKSAKSLNSNANGAAASNGKDSNSREKDRPDSDEDTCKTANSSKGGQQNVSASVERGVGGGGVGGNSSRFEKDKQSKGFTTFQREASGVSQVAKKKQDREARAQRNSIDVRSQNSDSSVYDPPLDPMRRSNRKSRHRGSLKEAQNSHNEEGGEDSGEDDFKGKKASSKKRKGTDRTEKRERSGGAVDLMDLTSDQEDSQSTKRTKGSGSR